MEDRTAEGYVPLMTGVAVLNPPMVLCRNQIMNRVAAFRFIRRSRAAFREYDGRDNFLGAELCME